MLWIKRWVTNDLLFSPNRITVITRRGKRFTSDIRVHTSSKSHKAHDIQHFKVRNQQNRKHKIGVTLVVPVDSTNVPFHARVGAQSWEVSACRIGNSLTRKYLPSNGETVIGQVLPFCQDM